MSSPSPFSGPFDHASRHTPFDPFGDLNPLLVGDCGAMLERLWTFLDGELTDERREKIRRHLDGCPSCFSVYDFEAELRIVVSTRSQSEVPQTLVARIRTALYEADGDLA